MESQICLECTDNGEMIRKKCSFEAYNHTKGKHKRNNNGP